MLMLCHRQLQEITRFLRLTGGNRAVFFLVMNHTIKAMFGIFKDNRKTYTIFYHVISQSLELKLLGIIS